MSCCAPGSYKQFYRRSDSRTPGVGPSNLFCLFTKFQWMTYASGHQGETRFAPGTARTRWQRSESPATTRQRRRRSQRRYPSSSTAYSCTFAAEVGLASDSAAYTYLAHHLPCCLVDDAHALLPGAWAHLDLAEAAAVGWVAEVRTGFQHGSTRGGSRQDSSAF